MGNESLGRRNSRWSVEQDDHEVISYRKIKSPYSLSPEKRKEAERFGAFMGRKPRPFLSGLKHGFVLALIFALLGFQDAIFTGMGY